MSVRDIYILFTYSNFLSNCRFFTGLLMVLKKRVLILVVDKKALVAELVDVVDLGSTALRCVGSSPTGGNITK